MIMMMIYNTSWLLGACYVPARKGFSSKAFLLIFKQLYKMDSTIPTPPAPATPHHFSDKVTEIKKPAEDHCARKWQRQA